MSVSTGTAASVFKLRAPLMAQGRMDTLMAKTDLMSVVLKVYAEGGENTMHAHPTEDHTFVVLQGQATFRLDSDDNVVVVDKFEGVMFPKGSYYWFHSSGDENLVMLRVGAAVTGSASDRLNIHGEFMAGDSLENKQVEPIAIPGKYFEA